MPDARGAERLWVGPRADRSGPRVLLRTAPVKPGNKRLLGFDGIALVDLRGNGVRELTRAGGSSGGTVASAADSKDDSLSSVSGTMATIGDRRSSWAGVPPTAEGLIVQPEAHRDRLDGDLGKDGRLGKIPQQLAINRRTADAGPRRQSLCDVRIGAPPA